MRVGIVVQARVHNSRLPLKEFLEWNGTTILGSVLARCAQVPADAHILAVPEKDLSLYQLFLPPDWSLFGGDEDNVTLRFLEAATEHSLDWVIRVTADSPLLIPEVVSCVKAGIDPAYDIVDSGLPRSFGIGAISRAALIHIDLNGTPEEKEHVFMPDLKIKTLSIDFSIDTLEQYRALREATCLH